MEAVAPGVYQVNSGSRSFVIDGDESLTLVDTGLPKKAGAAINLIRSIGRSVEDVGAIVLTHSHADHAGNAADLKRATSLGTLAGLQFSTACFGHSDPLTDRASAAFKDFARSL